MVCSTPFALPVLGSATGALAVGLGCGAAVAPGLDGAVGAALGAGAAVVAVAVGFAARTPIVAALVLLSGLSLELVVVSVAMLRTLPPDGTAFICVTTMIVIVSSRGSSQWRS